MEEEGVPPTIITYNALSTCEKVLQPFRAEQLFDTVQQQDITPTIITRCTLINA